MSMSPLQIKQRIEALEWEIRCNEEENDHMREEIKLLEQKLANYYEKEKISKDKAK